MGCAFEQINKPEMSVRKKEWFNDDLVFLPERYYLNQRRERKPPVNFKG